MKKYIKCTLVICAVVGLMGPRSAFAEEGHEHKEGEKQEAHADGEEEGHSEGSAAVGPDKGITEKGKHGFKLSADAMKTIAPTLATYTPGSIPCAAVVSVKDGKYAFRSRDGWFKKVTIEVITKSNGTCTIRSNDLQAGDQIVMAQTGFLRVAEVLLEEGASHSH